MDLPSRDLADEQAAWALLSLKSHQADRSTLVLLDASVSNGSFHYWLVSTIQNGGYVR